MNRAVGVSKLTTTAADGTGAARMTSVNVPERMNELSDRVIRPVQASNVTRAPPSPAPTSHSFHGSVGDGRLYSTLPTPTASSDVDVRFRVPKEAAMMRKWLLALSLLLTILSALLLGAGLTRAGDVDSATTFALRAVIKLPNAQKISRFDISWIDQASQTYYLADRTNAQIDVFDARNDTFVQALAHGVVSQFDSGG